VQQQLPGRSAGTSSNSQQTGHYKPVGRKLAAHVRLIPACR
jgi:hypothetical protein